MSKLPRTWVDTVAKIRQTLDVGAMLNQPVKFQPDGAKALSELLLRMASALDQARADYDDELNRKKR